jgi:hypothetical protein
VKPILERTLSRSTTAILSLYSVCMFVNGVGIQRFDHFPDENIRDGACAVMVAGAGLYTWQRVGSFVIFSINCLQACRHARTKTPQFHNKILVPERSPRDSACMSLNLHVFMNFFKSM